MPATLRDVWRIVERLSCFASTEEIEELSTPVIKSFLYEGKLERSWSSKTIRLYRQYLKTFFAWCVSERYLRRNPVDRIDTPRVPQTLPRCLSRKEALLVLYSASAVRWGTEVQRSRAEAVVATFLMTGVRRSELLRLRTSDLDLESGVLSVRGGKGRKDRVIPLHPRLIPILKRYLAEKSVAGVLSPWLFSSLRSSSSLTDKNLYSVLERVAAKSGVKFTPHMLRHTFGRELVEADFNIYKLKEVMGHASVATTQSYVALSQQNIKESFERTEIY